MSAQILVGTASWTDQSLVQSKRFYPKGCTSAEARLRYYSSVFPTVEVDSSYYAMPSRSNAEKWVERTPDDFVFNIKAFRLFTGHQTPRQALPKDIQDALAGHFAKKRNLYYADTPAEILDELWRRYESAIRPMHQAGKLAAVHFQFPKWFLPGSDAWAHIDDCMTRLDGYRLATEFRRDLWFDEAHRTETLHQEQARGLVHTVVDAPPGKASAVPAIWSATSSSLAIVRLHGRNEETWDVKDAAAASDRFNYDYSEAELSALVPQIRELADQVLRLQIIFNNNHEDQGQRNARTMMGLLGQATPAPGGLF